jgi:hypothetical protein
LAAAGVPAVAITAIRYVAELAAVLVMSRLEITAVVEAPVLYNVPYVDTEDVPCNCAFLYVVAI